MQNIPEEFSPLIFNEYIEGDQLGNIQDANLSALIKHRYFYSSDKTSLLL